MEKITLKELLKHFPKTIWVDLCTPQWRKCGEVQHIENECSDSMLNSEVARWSYNKHLTIDM